MRKGKGGFIAFVALVVAAVGVIIALAAYFKNRSSYLYDEDDFLFDDPSELEYYTTDLDEEDLAPEDEPTVQVLDDEMALNG